MNKARGRGSRDEAVITVQREMIKPSRDNRNRIKNQERDIYLEWN